MKNKLSKLIIKQNNYQKRHSNYKIKARFRLKHLNKKSESRKMKMKNKIT